MEMILLFLPCADDKEASKIAKMLLDNKLVACVKRIPIESAYFWQGKVKQDHETLLILESVEEKYDEIEEEVRKIHSYETFVLTAIPVVKYSEGVKEWLEESLK